MRRHYHIPTEKKAAGECGELNGVDFILQNINLQMLQKSNEDLLLLHWGQKKGKSILNCQARNFSGGI